MKNSPNNLQHSVLLLAVFLLASCVTHGNWPPPEAAYWSQDGYSFNDIVVYASEDCMYEEIETTADYYDFQHCMLDGGFVYLESQYDEYIAEYGYAPTSKQRKDCFKNKGYRYDYPGCIALRQRLGAE